MQISYEKNDGFEAISRVGLVLSLSPLGFVAFACGGERKLSFESSNIHDASGSEQEDGLDGLNIAISGIAATSS